MQEFQRMIEIAREGKDEAISPEEIERLKNSGVINYVASDDKVGALLFHSENRVFCKINEFYFVNLGDKAVEVSNYNQAQGMSEAKDLFIPHSMQAFHWDSNNKLVQADRSKLSSYTEQLTQDAYKWNIENGRPLDKILDWVIENKKVIGGTFVAKMYKVILSEVISHKYSNEIVVDSIIYGVNNGKQVIIKEIEGFINSEEKNIKTFVKFIEAEAEILKKSITKEAESLKEQIEKAVSIATDVEARVTAVASKGSEFLDEEENLLDGIGKDFDKGVKVWIGELFEK